MKPQLQSIKTVSQRSLCNVRAFSEISRHLPPCLITASENCLKSNDIKLEQYFEVTEILPDKGKTLSEIYWQIKQENLHATVEQ